MLVAFLVSPETNLGYMFLISSTSYRQK